MTTITSDGRSVRVYTVPSILPRRRMIIVPIIAVLLVASTILHFARAYIISGELPSHGRIALLRKLTDDTCNAHPGTLAAIDLTRARELLSAWADWDVVGSSSHAGSGRERAILQEGLLERMIDERNAGNALAIARDRGL